MRVRSIFCVVAVALSSLAPVRADLQSDYLDIYLRMNDAAKLQNGGDLRNALAEFEDCYTRLHKMHLDNPQWENVLVSQRMSDCHARILALEQKLAPPPDKPAPTVAAAVTATPAPESVQARLAALQAAVKAAPNDASAWMNLGTAFFQLDQTTSAIDALQHGLTLEPGNIYGHNFLGCALLRQGRIETAAHEFQKSIALEETFPEPHYNLAILYATEDPPATNSARAQYKRALELGLVPDPHLERVLHVGSR